MLTALDLQWIHWSSFFVGAIAAYVLPWTLLVLVVAGARGIRQINRWRRRGAEFLRAAERAPAPDCVWCVRAGLPRCFCLEQDPIEGAFTVPQDDETKRYRRMVDEILGPRERLLSRAESDALFRSVMGDPSNGRTWQ